MSASACQAALPTRPTFEQRQEPKRAHLRSILTYPLSSPDLDLTPAWSLAPPLSVTLYTSTIHLPPPLLSKETLCPGVQSPSTPPSSLVRSSYLTASIHWTNKTTTGGRNPTTMAYNNQQQDNRNPNRLQLNFGFQNNPQTFSSEQARAFPTTPSTFPQPFPNAAGQQEVWGTQTPQQPGLNPQGYFNNFNPYGSQLQQGQGQGPVQTPGVPGPAPNTYRAPGAGGAGFNEVTNGFAQQMNLGGNSPRSASPYGRNGSPANGRPRTAGNGTQPYGSYLSAPVPGQPQQPSIYDEQVPPKNPEKYSAAITERVRHQKMLTGEFFKENVERAKTRNERYSHPTTMTLCSILTL